MRLDDIVTRETSPMTLVREDDTWKVVSLDPAESTVTLTTVPTDGTPTDADTDPASGLAEFAFIGEEAESYSVRITSATIAGGSVTVIGPSTEQTVSITSGEAFVDAFEGEDGVYEIIVTPASGQSGTVTAEVFIDAGGSDDTVPDRAGATPEAREGPADPSPQDEPSNVVLSFLTLSIPLLLAVGGVGLWIRRRRD
jgi:hypothetical protein